MTIRRKIKKQLLLTQDEVDTAQGANLRHWKGANVKARRFVSVDGLDMRETNADYTAFTGDLRNTTFGDLRNQTVEGRICNQMVKGHIYNDGMVTRIRKFFRIS